MLAKTTAHQDIPRQATGQGIGQGTSRSSGQGNEGYSVRHGQGRAGQGSAEAVSGC